MSEEAAVLDRPSWVRHCVEKHEWITALTERSVTEVTLTSLQNLLSAGSTGSFFLADECVNEDAEVRKKALDELDAYFTTAFMSSWNRASAVQQYVAGEGLRGTHYYGTSNGHDVDFSIVGDMENPLALYANLAFTEHMLIGGAYSGAHGEFGMLANEVTVPEKHIITATKYELEEALFRELLFSSDSVPVVLHGVNCKVPSGTRRPTDIGASGVANSLMEAIQDRHMTIEVPKEDRQGYNTYNFLDGAAFKYEESYLVKMLKQAKADLYTNIIKEGRIGNTFTLMNDIKPATEIATGRFLVL